MTFEELAPGQLVEVAVSAEPEEADLVIVLRTTNTDEVIGFSELEKDIVVLSPDYEYELIADDVFEAIYGEDTEVTLAVEGETSEA